VAAVIVDKEWGSWKLTGPPRRSVRWQHRHSASVEMEAILGVKAHDILFAFFNAVKNELAATKIHHPIYSPAGRGPARFHLNGAKC
jgi:hypothetical protein